MSFARDDLKTTDPGLVALDWLLRLKGVTVEVDQLRRWCGTVPVGTPQMKRCAKKLGLSAVRRQTNWAGLAAEPLPAIATLRDGGFLLVGKATQERVAILRPSCEKPELMTQVEFEAV